MAQEEPAPAHRCSPAPATKYAAMLDSIANLSVAPIPPDVDDRAPPPTPPPPSPLAHLSPEVLAAIFMHCAATQPSHRPYGWIRVTHVCRHWRSVALAFAPLWARIVLSERHPLPAAVRAAHLDRLNTVLARAATAPLSLLIHLPLEHDVAGDLDRVQRALAETPRVRELRLEFPAFPAAAFPHIWCMVAAPPAALESLVLRLPWAIPDAAAAALPPFAAAAPRLRTLELSGYEAPFHLACAMAQPGLRRVDLTGIPFRSQRPSAAAFLALLAALPLLEHLSIHDTLPLPPAPADPARVVALPHLRFLCLTGRDPAAFPAITHCLDRLAFPAAAALALGGDDFSPAVAPPLLRAVSAKLAAALGPIRRIRIAGHSSILHIQAWADPRPPPPRAPCQLELWLGVDPDPARTSAALLTLHAGLPFDDVHVFHVAFLADVPAAPIVRVLFRMRAVRELGIAAGAAEPEFLPVLLGHADAARPIFPALRILALNRIDFRAVGRAASPAAPTFFDRLCDALRARRALGSVLDRITITKGVNLSAADVRRLRTLAGALELDEETAPLQ